MLALGVLVVASNISFGVVTIFVGDPFVLRDNSFVPFADHFVVFENTVGGILVAPFSALVVTFAATLGDIFLDSFNDRFVTFGGSVGVQVFKTGTIG